MIVRQDFEKEWPNCAHYIRQFLSDEATFKQKYFMVYSAYSKVVTMQLDASQMGRAVKRVSETFTLGDGPEVLVADLGFAKKWGGMKTGGLFDPGPEVLGYPMRNLVRVDTLVANAYERGHGWMTFEGVLLHECVHWARFNAGDGDRAGGKWNTLSVEFVDNPANPGAAFEAGDLFDLWAYGFDICQAGPDGKVIEFGPPETLPTKKLRGAAGYSP